MFCKDCSFSPVCEILDRSVCQSFCFPCISLIPPPSIRFDMLLCGFICKTFEKYFVGGSHYATFLTIGVTPLASLPNSFVRVNSCNTNRANLLHLQLHCRMGGKSAEKEGRKAERGSFLVKWQIFLSSRVNPTSAYGILQHCSNLF